MYSNQRKPRRGGAEGVWCLGNNEPDGKPFLVTRGNVSEAFKTRRQADDFMKLLRLQEQFCRK